MNGHDLYKAILKATNTFGLATYEMNLIKVSFDVGEVTFTFENKKITVKI